MLIGVIRGLVIVGCLTLSAYAQKHPEYPTVITPPHTPQEILLLFSGNTADERILLTLNNNRPTALTTSVTVYTATGFSVQLPDVQMVPQESKMIELSPQLRQVGLGYQELGWIRLNYSGVTLELGAQLTLYPDKNGPGIDSPRSLTGDFKSTERDAVFWMPEGGKARLALTNQSAGSIFVKMRCGQDSDEFAISGKTTTLKHIELPGENLIFHAGKIPVACELLSDGPIDALRPVGTVVAHNYSAPIRFYDPQTATFPSLTAVGLETTAETHVTVHNVSSKPIELVPILREAALSAPKEKSLPMRMLSPHGSVEIEIGSLLKEMQLQGIYRTTLTLKTDAPKGSLVGAVTQISSPEGLVEDIPLRTSNPPAFARGSYPLRWDEDYTNAVTVTNTANETLRIGGEITAGEVVYVLTRENIQPGATIVFDVDRWKREGIPDVNGRTIPKDAPYGKIHWTEMSNGTKAGLLGRTSLSSIINRRKSSFSCGSTCQYNFIQHAFYDLGVATFLRLGDVQNSALTEFDSLLNGASYTYPVPYLEGSVRTYPSSVMSAGADSTNPNHVILHANAVGTTDIYNDFYNDVWYYDPPNEVCVGTENFIEQSGTATVYACPSTVTIADRFFRALPSITAPDSLTGVGMLSKMLVSPSVATYTGAQIQELVTPLSNTCPANIAAYTSYSPFVSTFTVGGGAFWEGIYFPPILNSFYDQHVNDVNLDVLAYTSGASCTATARQIYSCNGQNIGTFTLTKTFDHGILSGVWVTNVTVTKQ